MPIYSYTPIDDPLAKAPNGTQVLGINASGQLVGIYFSANAGAHGFLYSGGTYTTVDDPLAVPTLGTEDRSADGLKRIHG